MLKPKPPRPSPKQTLKIGRQTLKVGGTLRLELPIKRIGPLDGRDAVTVMLPDGTRHTLSALLLEHMQGEEP